MQYESQEKTINFIVECAKAAENLRSHFQNIIFVVGGELTLFTNGFVKGDTGGERLKNMFGPMSLIKNMLGIKRTYNARLNKFLSNAVNKIKEQFHGQITYASGSWEKPDWRLFDIIGVDLYRASYNKAVFLKELQNNKQYGKALSIMEFGCCTYKGAEDKGGVGWAIVDWGKKPPQLNGTFTRDEEVQSNYLMELLNIFETEKVFATFVFTFVTYNYTYNTDAHYDLDMASYGIVRSMPASGEGYYHNLPWVPKRSFFELGNYYASR